MSEHESGGVLRPCPCGSPDCPAFKWTDLGHGVAMRWENDRARLLLRHAVPAGGRNDWQREGDECHAMICVDSPEGLALAGGKPWHLESWDPLTISPSILCGCGHHGFVRDGKWVPA